MLATCLPLPFSPFDETLRRRPNYYNCAGSRNIVVGVPQLLPIAPDCFRKCHVCRFAPIGLWPHCALCDPEKRRFVLSRGLPPVRSASVSLPCLAVWRLQLHPPVRHARVGLARVPLSHLVQDGGKWDVATTVCYNREYAVAQGYGFFFAPEPALAHVPDWLLPRRARDQTGACELAARLGRVCVASGVSVACDP